MAAILSRGWWVNITVWNPLALISSIKVSFKAKHVQEIKMSKRSLFTLISKFVALKYYYFCIIAESNINETAISWEYVHDTCVCVCVCFFPSQREIVGGEYLSNIERGWRFSFCTMVFTRGQYWPSGIAVACVCLCVCVSVRVSITSLSAR